MKYIIVLTAVLSVVMYYIIAAAVCRLKEPGFRRRFLTGVLIAALLVSQTGIVDIFMKTEATTVAAAEQEAESGADAEESVEARSTEVRTVTAFAELPEDIREQAVPVRTALEELVLPDTLEAVCVAAEADTEDNTDTTDSNVGGGTSDNGDDADDETPSDEGDADNVTPSDEDDAEDAATGEEDEAEDEVSESSEDDSEEEQQESSGDDSEEETAATAVRTETGSFVTPEYRTEHVIEIKTLEEDSESEDSDAEKEEDTDISGNIVTIENITWQSEPEYDGDTEGEYIFTAVLPEGYVLTREVNAPRITVTVGGTDNIALLSGDIMPIAASDVGFAGGNGTADDPYQIETAEQLEAFRDDVNSGNNYEDQFIKLMQDIPLQNVWNVPIGEGFRSPFSGTFDGNEKIISGLQMEVSSNGFEGLFGCIANGTVKNLTVEGNIAVYVFDWSLVSYEGGIAGYLSGNMENCVFRGTVEHSDAGGQALVGNSFNTVGGIAGYNAGEVKDCHNYGTVTTTIAPIMPGPPGDGVYTGGIVGGELWNNNRLCQ